MPVVRHGVGAGVLRAADLCYTPRLSNVGRWCMRALVVVGSGGRERAFLKDVA
jgi:hypothetical protein